MNSREYRTSIKQFILKFIENNALKNDDDIFSLGYVDSLFAMQLVLFVESEFQVTVDDDDLDLDNFRSVNILADFVERKLDTAAQV